MHITLRVLTVTVLCSAAAVIVAFTSSQRASAQDMGWKRFELLSNGVSLRVPLGVFEALPADKDAQGQLFAARIKIRTLRELYLDSFNDS